MRVMFPMQTGTSMTASLLRNNLGKIANVSMRGYKSISVPRDPTNRNNTSFNLQDWGLPSTNGRIPTASDLAEFAKNPPAISNLGKIILDLAPREHTVLAAGGIPHFYMTISKADTITNPAHVSNLGNNLSRIFWSLFPNGSVEIAKEYPLIRDGYAAQLMGKVAGGVDLLQGADVSGTRRANYKANAPLEGAVRLGSSSYIIQSNHTITSDANRHVSFTLQVATDTHIFKGATLKIIVTDKQSGQTHIIVIGGGEHSEIRSLAAINRWMQTTLWTTMAESFVALINHYGGQAEQGADAFVDIIVDSRRMKDVLDPISPETKNRRTFLGLADNVSGLVIAVTSPFTQKLEDDEPPPSATSEEVSSIEAGLDTLTPDEPLLSEDDLQALSNEEQSDSDALPAETGTPDETTPDAETRTPDETTPDAETRTPDETTPDTETGTPDETTPDAETGTPDKPISHEPGLGHGE